jgi:hypothetical protein
MTDINEVIATTRTAIKHARKMSREPKAPLPEQPAAPTEAAPAKRESKTDLVLALLKRAEGATIEQLAAATGWLPHTTRAALTGLKKKGHLVTSSKLEGQGRVYRIAAQ